MGSLYLRVALLPKGKGIKTATAATSGANVVLLLLPAEMGLLKSMLVSFDAYLRAPVLGFEPCHRE